MTLELWPNAQIHLMQRVYSAPFHTGTLHNVCVRQLRVSFALATLYPLVNVPLANYSSQWACITSSVRAMVYVCV